MKKVTRTYFSKKLNKTVTKTYTYNKTYGGRNKKSLLIVGKRGVYKDRLDDLVKYYKNEGDLAMAADIQAIVEQAPKNKKMSIKSLLSKAAETQYEKMIINSGYTLEEAAKELGVTENELLNEDNWQGSTFVNPATSSAFEFVFTYNNTIWRQV